MQTLKARRFGRFLWPAALDSVCGVIIVSFVFIALGYLHPALALPQIGLGILGALSRPVRVRHPVAIPPSDTEDPPAEKPNST